MKSIIICLCVVLTQGASEFLKTWMSNRVVQEKTIMELTFPASHDSHTYGIEKSSNIFKKCKRNGGRCQKSTIKEQLEAGVRALDIRLVHEEGQDLGTAHWVMSGNFKPMLGQIMEFLKTNKSEIVFLKLKEDKRRMKNLKVEEIADLANTEIDQVKEEKNFNELQQVRIKDVDIDRKISDLVELNMRLVLILEGSVEATYKDIKAKTPADLMKKILRKSHELQIRDDNGEYCWMSMQVTNLWNMFKKRGYKQDANDSAEMALNSHNEQVRYYLTKCTRKGSNSKKLYNFVGMDMIGSSENINALVKLIIDENQKDSIRASEDSSNGAVDMDVNMSFIPSLPKMETIEEEEVEIVEGFEEEYPEFPMTPRSRRLSETPIKTPLDRIMFQCTQN